MPSSTRSIGSRNEPSSGISTGPEAVPAAAGAGAGPDLEDGEAAAGKLLSIPENVGATTPAGKL